jgi:copper resistance protein C
MEMTELKDGMVIPSGKTVTSNRKDKSMFSKLKPSLIAGGLAIAMSSQASAHAHLASATPAIGGTVAASPSELDLKFSEALNLKFSGVKIAGPDKATITTGLAALTKGDESTLVVPIAATLATGTYTVDWHVLSKDGHKTHGSYTFTVKP